MGASQMFSRCFICEMATGGSVLTTGKPWAIAAIRLPRRKLAPSR